MPKHHSKPLNELSGFELCCIESCSSVIVQHCRHYLSFHIFTACLQAYSQAGKYLIENFVIHGLVAAVALPMTVLNVSGVIDSSWAVVNFESK